jgi:hypothetical protein
MNYELRDETDWHVLFERSPGTRLFTLSNRAYDVFGPDESRA